MYTHLKFNIVAPEKLPFHPKGSRIVSQPLFFRGYVKLRECNDYFIQILEIRMMFLVFTARKPGQLAVLHVFWGHWDDNVPCMCAHDGSYSR